MKIPGKSSECADLGPMPTHGLIAGQEGEGNSLTDHVGPGARLGCRGFQFPLNKEMLFPEKEEAIVRNK